MGLEELGPVEHARVGLQLDRPAQCVHPRGAGFGRHVLSEPEQHRLPQLLGGDGAAGNHPVLLVAVAIANHERLEHLAECEHGEQRDDVGEALVERGLVGRRRSHEPAAQAVEQRVRGLVHHDVVREGQEDGLVVAAVVAEDEGLRFARVERVHLLERVGEDLELVGAGVPGHAAPERVLEASERAHDEGVDVPGVKPGVAQDLRVVGRIRDVVHVRRVRGRVHRSRGRVVVDDLNPVAGRPAAEVLPGDLDGGRQDRSVALDAGVLGQDGHAPRALLRHGPILPERKPVVTCEIALRKDGG